MKVRDLFAIYLDGSIRARQEDARISVVRQREEQEALRRDIALLKRLISAVRRLDEKAPNPKARAARAQRDRERQERIRATLASADRRIAALKARRASGRPSGPMEPEKATKEAERVRKLDQQASDVRAGANEKVAGIRSKMGR